MTRTDLLPLPLRAWAAKSGPRVGGRGPAARCPDAPPTPAPPPHSRPLRNGNPSGNPNLAPRCGAKNRAGCPSHAPAMPNGRCRLHGGKSTGSRTPKGIARRAAANTKHGRQSAAKRVQQLYVTTATRRGRLTAAARRLEDYLPKGMAARLADGPPELWAPIHPTNLLFVKNPEPTPGHRSPARLPPDAGPARKAAVPSRAAWPPSGRQPGPRPPPSPPGTRPSPSPAPLGAQHWPPNAPPDRPNAQRRQPSARHGKQRAPSPCPPSCRPGRRRRTCPATIPARWNASLPPARPGCACASTNRISLRRPTHRSPIRHFPESIP